MTLVVATWFCQVLLCSEFSLLERFSIVIPYVEYDIVFSNLVKLDVKILWELRTLETILELLNESQYCSDVDNGNLLLLLWNWSEFSTVELPSCADLYTMDHIHVGA